LFPIPGTLITLPEVIELESKDPDKLGRASQEIVDAAVALHTLQNIANASSVNTIVKIFKDLYGHSFQYHQVV